MEEWILEIQRNSGLSEESEKILKKIWYEYHKQWCKYHKKE